MRLRHRHGRQPLNSQPNPAARHGNADWILLLTYRPCPDFFVPLGSGKFELDIGLSSGEYEQLRT
jgi:hypothetical protein